MRVLEYLLLALFVGLPCVALGTLLGMFLVAFSLCTGWGIFWGHDSVPQAPGIAMMAALGYLAWAFLGLGALVYYIVG